MDSTLLTTVEQLSDDTPNNRGAGWPAGSVLASSPQTGQPGLASAVQNGVREDQSGAADPHERYANRLSPNRLACPCDFLQSLLALLEIQVAHCTSSLRGLTSIISTRSGMAGSSTGQRGLVISAHIPRAR